MKPDWALGPNTVWVTCPPSSQWDGEGNAGLLTRHAYHHESVVSYFAFGHVHSVHTRHDGPGRIGSIFVNVAATGLLAATIPGIPRSRSSRPG